MKKAKKYFIASLSKSRKGSRTQRRTQLALAEIYYNQRKYRKAAKLYASALRKKDDRWWTKDSFNLGWSYFRLKQYDKAIATLREVHERSKNKKFIDMSREVRRDLTYFYTEAGRVDEVVDFYKDSSDGDDIVANLLKVGEQLKNQGKSSVAQKVFEEALNRVKNDKQRIQVYHQLLSIYDRLGATSKTL